MDKIYNISNLRRKFESLPDWTQAILNMLVKEHIVEHRNPKIEFVTFEFDNNFTCALIETIEKEDRKKLKYKYLGITKRNPSDPYNETEAILRAAGRALKRGMIFDVTTEVGKMKILKAIKKIDEYVNLDKVIPEMTNES